MSSVGSIGVGVSVRTANVKHIIVVTSLMVGIVLRYLGRDVTTSDTFDFLLPWYEHASVHGLASLGLVFPNYNYTPFYSYLLLLAAQFHEQLEALYLIKAISFTFELASAVAAARIVALGNPHPLSPTIAFIAVWTAPTVLFNGALWGQADAIWTFFILLTVYLFCKERWGSGVVIFGVAFAIKAQAVFLSPFIMVFVLRRKINWGWLTAIPLTYLTLGLPAWLLGKPALDIISVYLKQAGTFHAMTKGAANLWVFVPLSYSSTAVAIGSSMALVTGIAFAIFFAKSKGPWMTEQMVLASALTLLLMPFILPKMHDRYFYAFEVMAIVLACIKPRLAVIAIAAQISGIMIYSFMSPFMFVEGLNQTLFSIATNPLIAGNPLTWVVAAVINAAIAAFYIQYVRQRELTD